MKRRTTTVLDRNWNPLLHLVYLLQPTSLTIWYYKFRACNVTNKACTSIHTSSSTQQIIPVDVLSKACTVHSPLLVPLRTRLVLCTYFTAVQYSLIFALTFKETSNVCVKTLLALFCCVHFD